MLYNIKCASVADFISCNLYRLHCKHKKISEKFFYLKSFLFLCGTNNQNSNNMKNLLQKFSFLLIGLIGLALFTKSCDRWEKFEPFKYTATGIKLKSSGKFDRKATIPAEGVIFEITPKYKFEGGGEYLVTLSINDERIEPHPFPIIEDEEEEILGLRTVSEETGTASEDTYVQFSGEWGEIIRETHFPFSMKIIINENPNPWKRRFSLGMSYIYTWADIDLIQKGKE